MTRCECKLSTLVQGTGDQNVLQISVAEVYFKGTSCGGVEDYRLQKQVT
jgi:hypothetical protein